MVSTRSAFAANPLPRVVERVVFRMPVVSSYAVVTSMPSVAVEPEAARPRSPTPAWRTSSSRAVLRSRSACDTVRVSAEMAGRAVEVRTSTASVVVDVEGTVTGLLPSTWPVPATWKRSGAVSGAATE